MISNVFQGGKIHASCIRTHMFPTQCNLSIGEWCVTENFKVSQAGKRKYQPTSHQYKMTITNETVFTGSDHQVLVIHFTLKRKNINLLNVIRLQLYSQI